MISITFKDQAASDLVTTAFNSLFAKPDASTKSDEEWAQEVLQQWIKSQEARHRQVVEQQKIAINLNDNLF